MRTSKCRHGRRLNPCRRRGRPPHPWPPAGPWPHPTADWFCVHGSQPAAVIEDHRVPVTTSGPGPDDDAIGRGMDRCARWCPDVGVALMQRRMPRIGCPASRNPTRSATRAVGTTGSAVAAASSRPARSGWDLPGLGRRGRRRSCRCSRTVVATGRAVAAGGRGAVAEGVGAGRAATGAACRGRPRLTWVRPGCRGETAGANVVCTVLARSSAAIEADSAWSPPMRER